ncbi:glutaminase [Actinoplanes campanulatus]|uniref:Glutaminase n=1 Tax=Actinoplanes campanulatus TaxID=113559 RepID=A0A7W5AHE0_9ACTN|nr:glutaminase A [Actinoplanes campanulatus]MBB3096004.1 glutaminase [Actinoplanes campanulatus]GGN13042.1 glutaminase 2 [Actinoplanes campanulatus]GID36902.1 glutaminase 2 [Actinoplanes campanulatus]
MASDEYVSTGELPSPDQVRRSLDEAYEQLRTVTSGTPSNVYPALSRVPPDLFGICAAGTRGGLHTVGDADHGFTIMSVAKPFTFALVSEALGAETIRQRLGVNATGLPFNSLTAVERGPDGRTNPMVNPGAIATASLIPAADKWGFLQAGLSRFAGRELPLDPEVYASASATNHRNRALADLLETYRLLGCDPVEAVDLYTRQSCLRITAVDLALMGATLANGGVNPRTRERVVDSAVCHFTLAVMATAGLYETSGDWLYDVGVPGKSGIGGGIIVVSPGKGSLATFAPPLDGFGNSVRGQLAARFLSRRLGLTLFASEPAS